MVAVAAVVAAVVVVVVAVRRRLRLLYTYHFPDTAAVAAAAAAIATLALLLLLPLGSLYHRWLLLQMPCRKQKRHQASVPRRKIARVAMTSFVETSCRHKTKALPQCVFSTGKRVSLTVRS